MPLTDYFTGYRETVLRPGELIARVRIPLPLAPRHRLPQDRQAPLRRHLQRRGRVRARRRRRRRTPGRDRARRSGRDADPGDRDRGGAGRAAVDEATVAAAAEVLAGEGTPIDDHRASAAYRRAMLGQALRKLYAEQAHERLSAHDDVGERPARTRARRCTSRARRSTPTTSPSARRDLLHAHPVQAPHAHALITRLDPKPAYDVPGRGPGADRRRRARRQRRGRQARRAAVPDEVMFHGHAVCWVLGETLEAARLGAAAVEVDYEPLPSIVTRARGHRGRELPGRASRTLERGDVDGRARRVGARLRGRDRDRRPGALLPRDARVAGASSTRAARCSSSAARSTRPRPRRSSRTCSGCAATRSPCSACGWAAASAARRCSRTDSRRSPRSARR